VRCAGERVGTHTRISAGIPGLSRVQSSAPVSTGEYSLLEKCMFALRNHVKILSNFAKEAFIPTQHMLELSFLNEFCRTE